MQAEEVQLEPYQIKFRKEYLEQYGEEYKPWTDGGEEYENNGWFEFEGKEAYRLHREMYPDFYNIKVTHTVCE